MSAATDRVTLREIRSAVQDRRRVVSASIDVGRQSHEVWYRFTEASAGEAPDAFVAVTLMTAMRPGWPLRVYGAISPRLGCAIPAIQGIFRAWDDRCRIVPVEAARREPAPSPAGRGRACLFSGGVDSFYTLLRRHDQISGIILVHGFDIPLAALSLRANVSNRIRAAAVALGKPLIEVETNLRDFSDHYCRWDHYNGAALASVALLLSHRFSHVYAAATHAFAAPFPWHPRAAAGPLWSTEGTEVVVDDGYEVPRVSKTAFVARSDAALRWVRVCPENRGDAYNCGECEKCLRTMVALRIAGALDRCTAFARPLDLDVLSRLAVGHERYFMEENLDAAVRANNDPDLVTALRACLLDVTGRKTRR